MKMLKNGNISSLLKRTIKPAVLLLSLLVLAGCNKEFPNLLKQDYPDGSIVSTQNSKVLFVIVDGIEGDVLKELEPEELPTITEMIKNSMYSYYSLTDYGNEEVTDALGWTTLMTGVTSNKHGVSTDLSTANLEDYPTFISRIKSVKPEVKTAVYGSSSEFVNHLASDADEKATFSSDEETKNATVEELKNISTDIVVAQFHDDALDSDGSDADYIEAIKRFDSYLGELKATIEARENYKKENWIVIVTSNKGTVESEIKADKFEDKSRNTFTLFYAPKFSDRIIPKPASIPYSGTAAVYSGDIKAEVPDVGPSDIYRFDNKERTIQFLYKGSGEVVEWPVFMSKATGNLDGGGNGWRLWLGEGGQTMQVQVKSDKWGTGHVINDGEWHAITVVFFHEGNQWKLSTYMDGEQSPTIRNISAADLNTDQALRMGGNYGTGGGRNPNVLITNLQIYDTALPESVIINYGSNVVTDQTHPNWNNLVGYWPVSEGRGDVIKNYAIGASGRDFKLTGAYQWNSFTDITPNLNVPTNDSYYHTVPNSVDLPFQIYQWFGIAVPQSWGLEGRGWTPSYTQIRP